MAATRGGADKALQYVERLHAGLADLRRIEHPDLGRVADLGIGAIDALVATGQLPEEVGRQWVTRFLEIAGGGSLPRGAESVTSTLKRFVALSTLGTPSDFSFSPEAAELRSSFSFVPAIRVGALQVLGLEIYRDATVIRWLCGSQHLNRPELASEIELNDDRSTQYVFRGGGAFSVGGSTMRGESMYTPACDNGISQVTVSFGKDHAVAPIRQP